MLRRLAYFEAIAEAGSIRGAAQRLGLSVPVLSSSLSELEAELGVTLATRSTRRMDLTSAGQEIYDKASKMIEAAEGVLVHFTADRPLLGNVGVTLPAELALHWLPSRLSRFRSRHPEVTLSVDASDRVVELRNSPYDIAIRTAYRPGRPPDAGISGPGTGWQDVIMVSSQPPRTKKLSNNRGLEVQAAFMVGPGGQDWVAAYPPDSGDTVMLRSTNVIAVANREAAIAFAREGLGCALVTELAVRDDLETGRLIKVFPEMTFGGITMRTVMRDKRPSPEARALSEDLLGTAF